MGIALALAATISHSPWLLAGVIVVAVTLIWSFAPAHKVGLALRTYLALAMAVVCIRVGFRILFNIASPGQVTALNLPQISFHIGQIQIQFLGTISQSSLASGFIDGLRLSAIIMGVAMANTVANPRKLLRSTPSALYEVATAAAVAINLAPQLLASMQRVAKAQRLRGRSVGLTNFGALLIPVLEDSLHRSLELAASMDSRGFGRRGVMSNRSALAIRMALLSGLVTLAIGSYLMLSGTTTIWLPVFLIGLGLAFFATSVRLASSQNLRTRLILEKRRPADYGVLAFSILLVGLLAVAQIPSIQALGWLR